jgi:Mor family transcriptional regulator
LVLLIFAPKCNLTYCPNFGVHYTPSIKAPVKANTGKKKARNVTKKKIAAKKTNKVSNADKVRTLIKESAKGITTAELKKKTKLSDKQIWAIVNKAKKKGKIKMAKRGVYVAA